MPQGVPTFDRFDKKARDKYLKLLARGEHRSIAAETVGVSRGLVWLYRKQFPEFGELEKQAEIRANGNIENVLYKKAEAGDFPSIRMWLHNRSKKRWKNRKAVEVSGPNGRPIEVCSIEDLAEADKQLTDFERNGKSHERNGKSTSR
jgi:hypothetical protein